MKKEEDSYYQQLPKKEEEKEKKEPKKKKKNETTREQITGVYDGLVKANPFYMDEEIGRKRNWKLPGNVQVVEDEQDLCFFPFNLMTSWRFNGNRFYYRLAEEPANRSELPWTYKCSSISCGLVWSLMMLIITLIAVSIGVVIGVAVVVALAFLAFAACASSPSGCGK